MNTECQSKYLFYIEHYTYLRVVDKCVLLLNLLDFEYILSDNETVISLMARMQEDKKSSIEIDFCNIGDRYAVMAFFKEVKDKYMGDLLEMNSIDSKPIQFLFNAKVSELSLVRDGMRYVDPKLVLGSVHRLNIYLNGNCTRKCVSCETYYLQTDCCCKSQQSDIDLSVYVLNNIFKNVAFSKLLYLSRINFFGGDIYLYRYWDSLLDMIAPYKELCYAYFNYLNFRFDDKIINPFFEHHSVIMVDLDMITAEDMKKIVDYSDRYTFKVLVKKEHDFEILDKYMSNVSVELVPFYTGQNGTFFRDFVYTQKNDILKDRQSISQIQAKQILNPLFYGELFIFPDGGVKTNKNGSFVGNLKQNSIFEIVDSCLFSEDFYWFLTRRKTACGNCVFADLCPSISNYEIFMDNYKLCF